MAQTQEDENLPLNLGIHNHHHQSINDFNDPPPGPINAGSNYQQANYSIEDRLMTNQDTLNNPSLPDPVLINPNKKTDSDPEQLPTAHHQKTISKVSAVLYV